MYTKTFMTAALATAATASILEERQLGGLPASCSPVLNDLMTIIADIPTPPPELATVTMDPCASPTFTGEASSAYASYTSEALEWAMENQSALESGISECPQLTKFAGQAVPVCTSSISMTGGSSMTMPTGSSTGSPSSPTPTSGGGDDSGNNGGDGPDNAAPRVGGMAGVGAAIVAMGVAIAAL